MDIVGIIGAIVAGIATIGGGVKYLIERNDKKREKIHGEEIEERNKEREQIKADIKELREDVTNIASIVIGCEHPNCPSRKLLAEYYKNKADRQ